MKFMRRVSSNFKMRLAYLMIVLGGPLLFAGCVDSLVDTSYATTGEESINGIDAFLKLLEDEVVEERGGEVLRTVSLTNRVRKEADLVVYFERDFVSEFGRDEYYRNLESYLFGYDPEDLERREDFEGELESEAETELQEGPDYIDPDQSPEVDDYELEDQAEPIEIRTDRPRPLTREAPRFALQDEPPDSEQESADRYKTILYFLKDTTTTVAFWSRLADQLRDHPAHRAYCERQLEDAYLMRSLDSIPYLAPLSSRRTLHGEGKLLEDLRWNRAVFPESEFPNGGLRYPVRTVPDEVRSHFRIQEAEDLFGWSLLATAEGEHLIRQLELPFARLILVYNSESFLNHSQVHPGNRRLARYLLRHSLSAGESKADAEPIAAVVRNLVKTETAARNEFDILRFLKVFPLNVIVVHFFAILLLFLLSRWPHATPPLENRAAGSREFLEHIRALGVRLSRTTPRMKALEPLLRYKQKTTGRDYSAVIRKLEEAAGVRPENGAKQSERDG